MDLAHILAASSVSFLAKPHDIPGFSAMFDLFDFIRRFVRYLFVYPILATAQFVGLQWKVATTKGLVAKSTH